MAAGNKHTPDENSVHVDIEVEDDSTAQMDEQAKIDAAIKAGEEAAEAELAAEAAAAQDATAARIEELESDLEAAREEASTALERVTRIQADWENFRRRTAQEREAERARANERLVENLLPVIDDLERAIGHATGAQGDVASQLASGVEAVRAKLVDVLSKEGVSQINPAGEAFDPLQHQAVGRVENADVFEDTVCDVYQLGYEMAGKVIRPAMVTVSFGGPTRPAPQATDEAGSKDADETAQEAVEPDAVEPESPEEPPTQGGEEEDAS